MGHSCRQHIHSWSQQSCNELGVGLARWGEEAYLCADVLAAPATSAACESFLGLDDEAEGIVGLLDFHSLCAVVGSHRGRWFAAVKVQQRSMRQQSSDCPRQMRSLPTL